MKAAASPFLFCKNRPDFLGAFHIKAFQIVFSIKERTPYSPMAIRHKTTMDISTQVSLKKCVCNLKEKLCKI